ncbi:MAG: asparagine synthase C-terminal domain-containing protein [Anaerolineae bacterium]
MQWKVVLEEAVATTLARAEGARPALMYSAGLDSALVAKICQDLGHAPLLLSLGTTRSKDREFVERSRPYLNLLIRFITVSVDDIAEALPAVRHLLQEAQVTPNKMHLSLGVGTYLTCQIARQEGIGLLLAGQGADALFAGFYKYRRLPLEKLPAVLGRDVQSAMRKDFARDQAIAASFSIQFAAPFLTPSVVELALTIPADLKLGPEGNKLVLRELAKQRGLPDFIALRPKKAMQYSTGIQRVVERLQKVV